MKILITGAAGFIGSHVALRMINDGHKVCLISSKYHLSIRPNVVWEVIDLADTSSIGKLTKLMDSADYCCFLAAVKPPVDKAQDIIVGNTQIDRISSASFAASKCPSGMYISGLSIFSHRQNNVITEESKPDPSTEYTLSKHLGERLFKTAAVQTSKKWHILRINAPYGPGMVQHAVVSKFIREAIEGRTLYLHGQGERCQHFTWVRDCARVVKMLPRQESGIYHFCGPTQVSMLELAMACKQMAGSKSLIAFKDSNPGYSCPHFGLDRLESLWPRAKRTSLMEGLNYMIQAFKSGSPPIEDLET